MRVDSEILSVHVYFSTVTCAAFYTDVTVKHSGDVRSCVNVNCTNVADVSYTSHSSILCRQTHYLFI